MKGRALLLIGIMLFGLLPIFLSTPITQAGLGVLRVEHQQITIGEDLIYLSYSTNWRNTTVGLYTNNSNFQGYYSEGSDIEFTKTTTTGLHELGFYINSSGSNLWLNTSYTIAELRIEAFEPTIQDTYVWAYINPNKDCSYTVYENNSIEETGSLSKLGTSIDWLRNSTNDALILFGIYCYVGSEYVWCNGSYYNGQVTYFAIEGWTFRLNGGYCHMSIDVSLAGTATVYENDTLIDSFTLLVDWNNIYWSQETTGGVVQVGVKLTDGTTILWINTTYYVPVSYDWLKIRIFDTSGNLLPFDMFNVYINSSLTTYAEDYVDIAKSYTITVEDIWGTELNETTFSFDRHLDIELTIYKLYIKNYSTEFKYVRIRKVGVSGYLVPDFLAPEEEGVWYLYNGSYYLEVCEVGMTSANYIGLIMENNMTMHVNSDMYWVVSGVGFESILLYLQLLQNMSLSEYEALEEAVEQLNVASASFGMLFWLFLSMLVVLVTIVMGIIGRKRRLAPGETERLFREEKTEPVKYDKDDPRLETIDKYDKYHDELDKKMEEEEAKFVWE